MPRVMHSSLETLGQTTAGGTPCVLGKGDDVGVEDSLKPTDAG